MKRTEKTWLLEIVVGSVVAAILAALLGLWAWTAVKVVENGERITEVKAELQQEIAGVKAELQQEIAEAKAELRQEIAEVRVEVAEVRVDLQQEIAKNREQIVEVNAKLDLLISGLDISAVPEESAGAGLPGAERGGFQAGAGATATQ